MAIPLDARHALVLFSGGQDSATCLAWALAHYDHVETIGFDYGQRHRVELACRSVFIKALRASFPSWNQRLGEDRVLDLRVLGEISESALTRETPLEVSTAGPPNTFVPGRNLLFFNFAAAHAYTRGQRVLVGGMCETDYSGYPDCRDDTLKALQVAINLGMSSNFILATPLMWIDKAGTWALAQTLGGDDLVAAMIEHTHSCYLGDRSNRFAWGYGCGKCPACELRQNGWRRWTGQRDSHPTIHR